MGTKLRLIAAFSAAALLSAPLVFAAEPGARTWWEFVEEAANLHGIDPGAMLAAPFVLETLHADGTTAIESLTVGEMIERVDALGWRPRSGVAGTSEASVGNQLHAYGNVALGSALGYDIETSTLLPSSPPIALPPPATTTFFHGGGPWVSVKGSYAVGIHQAGTMLGSNADTHESGPFLPAVAEGTFVPDSSIDFAGFATVAQGQGCVFGLCIAFGLLQGTGAAFWSDEAVDLPVAP